MKIMKRVPGQSETRLTLGARQRTPFACTRLARRGDCCQMGESLTTKTVDSALHSLPPSKKNV